MKIDVRTDAGKTAPAPAPAPGQLQAKAKGKGKAKGKATKAGWAAKAANGSEGDKGSASAGLAAGAAAVVSGGEDVNEVVGFAKALASNEKDVRDRTIKALYSWVRAREKHEGELAELELLKLWKGLFYCLWMADKVPVQQELAKSIALLVPQFRRAQNSLGFVRCCFKTMLREWGGLGKWRIDKFYSLLRFVVHQALLLAHSTGNLELLGDILRDEVLMRKPNGIRYHVCDVFLDELFSTEVAQKLTSAQVQELLSPFYCALGFGGSDPLQEKVLDAVLFPLLGTRAIDALEISAVAASLFTIAADAKDLSSEQRDRVYEAHAVFKEAAALDFGGGSGGGEQDMDVDEELEELVDEELGEELGEEEDHKAAKAAKANAEEESAEEESAKKKKKKSAKKMKSEKKSAKKDKKNKVQPKEEEEEEQEKQSEARDLRKEFEELVPEPAEASSPSPAASSSAKKKKKKKKKQHQEMEAEAEDAKAAPATPVAAVAQSGRGASTKTKSKKRHIRFSMESNQALDHIVSIKRLRTTPVRPAAKHDSPRTGLLKVKEAVSSSTTLSVKRSLKKARVNTLINGVSAVRERGRGQRGRDPSFGDF